ncbi:MAG: CPBP family intramembrane metalloprotease [Bacteroides sp.]|nr:CPBP family intramembrane metalloprotease [Bacteroides sp.]MCM1549163.1 CPBP family intramembrane metalloprotease [Clostridium sp.]
MSERKERVLSIVLLAYLLLFLFRILEYFLLRTDQTFWGEAFVHKLIGIGILLLLLKRYGFKAGEVGFVKDKITGNLLKGLLFGVSVFVFAYLVEILMLVFQGKLESLDLYVSAYAVNGNIGNQTAPIFFIICIVGNVINVAMEEGVFRGLFQKLLEKRYSFIIAAVIASLLFGLWHIMAPIRNYYDGTMGLGGLLANMLMLAATSSLVGFKFAMMTRLTGCLYMAMGDHFVNNTIVNMLHVVSSTGTDEFMIMRVAIAQSVSFIFVCIWYIVKYHR